MYSKFPSIIQMGSPRAPDLVNLTKPIIWPGEFVVQQLAKYSEVRLLAKVEDVTASCVTIQWCTG